MSKPETIKELKKAGYKPRPVKDEIRENLIAKLSRRERLFPGVLGYEDTVIPQVVNALLARHNFILLGLRGQAKTRILRDLALFLDPEIPVLEGSEINDDPFAPISKYGKQLLQRSGDEARIVWVPRDARYVEKLATPDVTIADMIGDVDPIKAARGGHLLSDELTMHFGLLPRANRGIFAINELPDLAGKVQVGLFNIMQEGDVQLKGYPVRLPLDVLLVFSANPEDYTARGKIITPLKDRIGAEVRTHYPPAVQQGVAITKQEAWTSRSERQVVVPELLWEVVENVAFAARHDRRIDKRSGVSQRLPISVMETVVSNAERRALMAGEKTIAPRLADLFAALPSIVGKLELEYEGEQVGGEKLALELVRKASLAVFSERFGRVDLKPVLDVFNSGRTLTIAEMEPADNLLTQLRSIRGLIDAAKAGRLEDHTAPSLIAAAEVILEALHAQKKISRAETRDGVAFSTTAEERGQRAVIVDSRLNSKLN